MAYHSLHTFASQRVPPFACSSCSSRSRAAWVEPGLRLRALIEGARAVRGGDPARASPPILPGAPVALDGSALGPLCAGIRVADEEPHFRTRLSSQSCRAHKPLVDGGRAGIRTRERVAPLAVFKTAAFVRSATLPGPIYLQEPFTRAGTTGLVAAKLPPPGFAWTSSAEELEPLVGVDLSERTRSSRTRIALVDPPAVDPSFGWN